MSYTADQLQKIASDARAAAADGSIMASWYSVLADVADQALGVVSHGFVQPEVPDWIEPKPPGAKAIHTVRCGDRLLVDIGDRKIDQLGVASSRFQVATVVGVNPGLERPVKFEPPLLIDVYDHQQLIRVEQNACKREGLTHAHVWDPKVAT